MVHGGYHQGEQRFGTVWLLATDIPLSRARAAESDVRQIGHRPMSSVITSDDDPRR